MKYFAMVLCSLFFYCPLWADIIHVPGDHATIQAGIDAAVDGDTVLVADSTYIENINFLGKAITVASHFIMDGDTTHITNTIIDGSQPSNPDSGSVVTFQSGEDTTSVLMGFTITGGSGTESEYIWRGNTYDYRTGGGVLCYNAGASILHNRIIDNTIENANIAAGAGISGSPTRSDAYLIIRDNLIADNILGGEEPGGAAIDLNCHGIIKNNIIRENIATGNQYAWGAILSWSEAAYLRTLIIEDNDIFTNRVSATNLFGGGICVQEGYKTTIVGNYIVDNLADGTGFSRGGGIFLFDPADTTIINKNWIQRNKVRGSSATGGGIAIYDDITNNSFNLITNNIIDGDSARFGGGIYNFRCQAVLINNTIVNNQANQTGGGIWTNRSNFTVINTILWGNSANPLGLGQQILGQPTVAYSNVQDSVWEGSSNISHHPRFEDEAFHLSDSSLSIGRGTESITIGNHTYFAPLSDYEDTPRPHTIDGLVDIGADESPYLKVVVESIELLAGVLPGDFSLSQNSPNPFNPGTTIEFTIAKAGWVTLKIYNVLGEAVSELVEENLSTGSYKYSWDASGLPSGVYFYRLETNAFQQTRKLLLLK